MSIYNLNQYWASDIKTFGITWADNELKVYVIQYQSWMNDQSSRNYNKLQSH